jgi:hypothetical protein
VGLGAPLSARRACNTCRFVRRVSC